MALMDEIPTRPVLTVPEVADYLNMDPSTIYRLIRRKKFPHFYIGDSVRVRREDLLEYMKIRLVAVVEQ